MKILFVNPPAEHIITTTQAKYVISERGQAPPLGLLYLASTVKQRTNHDVRIIDCQVNKYTDEQLKQTIARYDPDIVGITTITFLLVDCLNVAKIVKQQEIERGKKIYVVAGGPHATIFPSETANLDPIDIVLAGEAEFTFIDLINHIGSTDALKCIPGVCFKRNGSLIIGPPHKPIENLDQVPIPDRRLVDYDKHYNVLSGSMMMTTMMTSRGCPYRCIFCDRLGKKFRAASAKHVIEEIEDCLSLGITYIFFHDDTFTIDKQRVLDICRMIKEKSLKFSFSLRSRVNTIDEDMVKALKEVGCVRISFGVESGVQRILKRIKKGITLEQAERAFRFTQKYRIKSLADFMIGHPDETIEDIHETIRFAKKLNPNYVQFSVTTPYPATELYREALDRGIIKKDIWKEFAENPKKDFTPPRWEETLSKHSIYKELHRCYREFYLNPHFIIKNIIEIRGWNELVRKIRAGMKLASFELLDKLGINRDGFR